MEDKHMENNHEQSVTAINRLKYIAGELSADILTLIHEGMILIISKSPECNGLSLHKNPLYKDLKSFKSNKTENKIESCKNDNPECLFMLSQSFL